jgi:hypothetical protein
LNLGFHPYSLAFRPLTVAKMERLASLGPSNPLVQTDILFLK